MHESHRVVQFNGRDLVCERCAAGAECLIRVVEEETGECSQPRVLHGGVHLFRMDDGFQSLYVVRSGSLKSYLTSEDGEEQILGFYSPGEVIGFDAIAARRHACSACALETSSVCALPFEALMRLAQRMPELYERLIHSMSRETLRLAERLVLGRRPAEQRLAAFLLELSDRQGERGYDRNLLRLSMSRTDVGKYLGLTVETVSRVLGRLQEIGLLSKGRCQVQLHDRAALQALARGGVEEPETLLQRAG